MLLENWVFLAVYVPQPKATRNTSTVRQVGFNFCCSEPKSSPWGTVRCLCKRVLDRAYYRIWDFVLWAGSREGGVHSRWGQKAGATLQGEQTRVRIKLQLEKQQQSLDQLREGNVWHFVGGIGTLFLSMLGQHHKMVLFYLILSCSQHSLAY